MLDSVKTTRYQIGTFSHLSDEIDTLLDGLRGFTQRVDGFFSQPLNVALVAAAVIASLALAAHLRGRLAIRSLWP
jgi:hypothetical protein